MIESIDCYLGFSINFLLKGVTSENVAAADTYGFNQIVLDSDIRGCRDCNPFYIPMSSENPTASIFL